MIEQAQVFSVAPHVHQNDTYAELRGVYADILKLQVLTCFFQSFADVLALITSA